MSNLLSKEQVLEWHCKVVREAMDYMNKEWPHSHRNMIANHIHNKFTSVISAIEFNENLQPDAPTPASGYSLEQIEKTKLKVANALLRGSAPFAIEIIDDLIRELKQLAPAEPAGEDEDICFLCGEPGSDKYAHPVHWPGEAGAGGTLVHAECEDEECRRAHAALTPSERESFLRTIK